MRGPQRTSWSPRALARLLDVNFDVGANIPRREGRRRKGVVSGHVAGVCKRLRKVQNTGIQMSAHGNASEDRDIRT